MVINRFFLVFVFLSFIFLIYYWKYDSISDDDIDLLEQQVISGLYGSTITSEWIKVIVENEEWETHFLHSSHINQTKPNILLLHGYGATSAITWRATIPGLIDKFNVILLLLIPLLRFLLL